MEKIKEINLRAFKIAEFLKKNDEILVVSHIDADGITSGAIAFESLRRAGKEVDIKFVKQLDEIELRRIADENKFTWFTDLGSGQLDLIEKEGIEFVITDHHIPVKSHIHQLNPHDFGYDGSYDLSGSTTTYLVAEKMGLNYDLSAIAIVGAIGDLQDSKAGKLVGLNRFIVNEAVKNGFVSVYRDLRFFGKQTRPVYKMLEYTFDPYMPGISGNERGAIEFLKLIDVRIKDDDKWLRWIDLSDEEKKRIVSEIVKICVEMGYPFNLIMKIVGDVYILVNEEEGTELRDAMEFSTLLNATARYGFNEIGLKVCLGERGDAFKKARRLLAEHRKNLSNGLRLVEEIGIYELKNIQFFHAGNNIPDTIVGIVAGMSFTLANKEKPVIAFAESDEGIKVSARATQKLVEKGIHLAKAISKAAERVGGKGGGHSIAAGATIPRGSEDEFLKLLDLIIGEQLMNNLQLTK